jgi:hypothetical protein
MQLLPRKHAYLLVCLAVVAQQRVCVPQYISYELIAEDDRIGSSRKWEEKV